MSTETKPLDELQELVKKNGKVKFDLMSVDGNAFSLMGHWGRAARKAEWSMDDIRRVQQLCMGSHSYDLLVGMLDSTCE